MGWRINLVKNDLIIDDNIKADIDAIPSWNDNRFKKPQNGIGIAYDGDKLFFTSAHLEWMDYVWHETVLDILLKHKANGEILFNSTQGDNAGTGWGYRFIDGVLTKLIFKNDEYVPA